MSHLRLQLVLSAVAGVMLGVATLHLLPHATQMLQSAERAMATALGGMLFMFFLNRMLHFHQHGTLEENPGEDPGHEHQRCGHQDHDAKTLETADVSSLGLMLGMTIHTLVDGVALGAAVLAHSNQLWSAAGLSVFLAIVLHKPLDAMSVTSLMAARRWSPGKIALANIAISLTAPLGVLLFALGMDLPQASHSAWIGAAMAFSAGTFLCISLGDLLPEVHFHKHDRLWLSTALLCGVLVSVLIEALPGHSHGNEYLPPSTARGRIDFAAQPGK
jgi:zinc and cadmium transporter